MTIALPTTPVPTSVEWGWVAPTLESFGASLKRQTRTRGGNRFGFRFHYRNVVRADIAPLLAALVQLRGRYNTMTCTLPGHTSPLGTGWGTPLSDGINAAGTRAITTKGMTFSITGAAKAGDFVKFSGHTKVYMVTADANSNGTGRTTLAIEPALIVATADGEAMTVTDVPFTVALKSDTLQLGAVPPYFASLDLDLQEAY
jgi:hypothetical protein